MKDKQSIPGLLMVKSAFDQIQTPISFTFTLLGWILDEVDPKGVAAPDVVADIISEIETSKGIIEEALKQATTVEQN